MIIVNETENVRTFTDEFSMREFSEYRCSVCGFWFGDHETFERKDKFYCEDDLPNEEEEDDINNG